MPSVSIIVPARDEELNIAPCVRSLLAAASGVDAEIIVANDNSTDGTRAAAASEGVKVLDVPPLPSGWVGKNHALAFASQQARGEWLLFTDADTRHAAGSLAAVLDKAKDYDLYSLSPEQDIETWWERAVIRRVYRELERNFSFAEINRPDHPAAAANGQYLLIRREVYDAIGGHAALAGEILEDVALARAAKDAGFRIHFEMGAGIVRTRMYTAFPAMWEGWTKNLFLLYGRDPRRILGAAARAMIDIPGGPLFAALLVNSWMHHRKGHSVAWKGREYPA